MKILLAFFPILFLLILRGYSQDTTIVLGKSHFDHNQVINLGKGKGWFLREGIDSSGISITSNSVEWKTENPSQILKSWADSKGKLEGWFRVKFRLDSSLKNLPLQLYVVGFTAVDVYIDGEKVSSHGNTSENNFQRAVPNWEESALPLPYKPGKDYLLSFHFLNQLPSFPWKFLLTDRFVSFDVLLTGPGFLHKHYNYIKNSERYETVWLTVSLTLTILFWLLAYQNPQEENLPLIALSSTFFSLSRLSVYLLMFHESPSLQLIIVLSILFNLFTALMISFIPIILSKIFKGRVSKNLWILFAIWSFCGFLNMSFNNNNAVNILLVTMMILVSFYYLISSWKNLKGAQWAIVYGVMITLGWTILYILKIWLLPNQLPDVIDYRDVVILTGLFLSFPISLLIFVSLRFREIIQETRENARQVVEMTEEKRQLALNQQIVLEEKVKERTNELNQSLEQLKATQTQLIHAEKMAALGELTAGIAHEIQNPLNFVNNFSEINGELSAELKDALKNGELIDANQLAEDIESNQKKILEHGLRADGIVKSMLQHSRKSSGQKEPTDINNLCDEYLRLSYHGMRARDKSFNSEFETDFDDSIGKINVIPQDISRVLLNVFNNAFYTVNEKAKKADDPYKPLVTVQTKKLGEKVEIIIKDNGEGIAEAIQDKILQPFFTTKPTGQGTGLGLSMSYDIVKAHNGNIHFESPIAGETGKGIEGTIFTIELPG